MRILVVEDEPTLLAQLVAAITAAGHTVEMARDGQEAAYLGEVEDFDAVVLDLGLPIVDGLSVLRGWRRQGRSMPVLILTARSSWHEKVTGMDAGADDYLAKPFHMEELLARLRALLRRSQAATTSILTLGALSIDTAAHQVMADGQSLDVGPREWTVLQYLMLHAPKPVSKEKLLQSLTGWDKEITPNAVEVYISRLRAKLEPYGIALRSIRGFGYRIEQRTN